MPAKKKKGKHAGAGRGGASAGATDVMLSKEDFFAKATQHLKTEKVQVDLFKTLVQNHLIYLNECDHKGETLLSIVVNFQGIMTQSCCESEKSCKTLLSMGALNGQFIEKYSALNALISFLLKQSSLIPAKTRDTYLITYQDLENIYKKFAIPSLEAVKLLEQGERLDSVEAPHFRGFGRYCKARMDKLKPLLDETEKILNSLDERLLVLPDVFIGSTVFRNPAKPDGVIINVFFDVAEKEKVDELVLRHSITLTLAGESPGRPVIAIEANLADLNSEYAMGEAKPSVILLLEELKAYRQAQHDSDEDCFDRARADFQGVFRPRTVALVASSENTHPLGDGFTWSG